MARTRFASLFEVMEKMEWENDFSNVVYQDLDASDSDVNDVQESDSPGNLRSRDRAARKKNRPLCQAVCECGNIVDVYKLACGICGRQKIPKTIDWRSLKRRAPKSPHLATRRVFEQVCQLHAAHNRDVVVLVHSQDGPDHQFKVWGTPAGGQHFLIGELGCAIRQAWRSQFVTETEQQVEPSVQGLPSDAQEDSMNTKGTSMKSTDSEGNDVYVVERVLGKMISEEDGKPRYHIKWLGYPDDVNTWEPEENIIDKSLLKPFL